MRQARKARAGFESSTKPASISLCMIVRDEEESLPRCLASVVPWVDEIVVCDTGSRDATVSIAKSYRAHVVHFGWCDDFAAARNFALSQASSSWVLSLDADEVVSTETAPNLRKLIARPLPDDCARAYQLLVRHYHNPRDESDRTEQFSAKLFTRCPGVGWISPIHEYIGRLDGGATQLQLIRTSEVIVEHIGHGQRWRDERRKSERNMALLRRAMEASPQDGYYPFKLAQHHLERGEASAALELARRAVRLGKVGGQGSGATGQAPGPSVRARPAAAALRFTADPQPSTPDWLSQAYVCLVGACLQAENLDEAASTCRSALDRFGDRAALWYQLGTVWLLQENLEEARRCYERALELGHTTAHCEPDPGMVTWRPLHGLGALSEIAGKNEEALSFYERACEFAPRNGEVNVSAGRMLARLGRWSEVESLLGQFLAKRNCGGQSLPDGVDDQALVLLAEAFEAQGENRFLDARKVLSGALASQPGLIRSRIKLGQLLCRAGEHAAALRCLGPALDTPQASSELYTCLADALAGLGMHEDAANARAIAARAQRSNK